MAPFPGRLERKAERREPRFWGVSTFPRPPRFRFVPFHARHSREILFYDARASRREVRRTLPVMRNAPGRLPAPRTGRLALLGLFPHTLLCHSTKDIFIGNGQYRQNDCISYIYIYSDRITIFDKQSEIFFAAAAELPPRFREHGPDGGGRSARSPHRTGAALPRESRGALGPVRTRFPRRKAAGLHSFPGRRFPSGGRAATRR